MKRSRTVTNAIIVAAFTAICVIGMEFLALNIGQPVPFSSNYTVHAVFSDADGVPQSADVRVSGVDVGKVTDIVHDPAYPGETVVTLQITDTHAIPIYTNGYAMVRPKTLLGEKYVDLSVGSGASSEPIGNDGFLPIGQAGKDVSNDEIFNAFDQQTRQQQQQVLAALDAATLQRAGDIHAILPQLQTVVANLQPVTNVYEKDQPQVDNIFVQLNTVMATLADEHQQLGGALNAGSIVLGAIADKDQALISLLQNWAHVSTDLNNAMAPTIAAQQNSIKALYPAFNPSQGSGGQNEFLNQVVGSHCGGKPCGIDEVFTGTLLGNINYPNDQLTVSTAPGELVTTEWDSMFSQPGPPSNTENRALNLVISLHCDAITQSLTSLLGPSAQTFIDTIKALATQAGKTC